MPGCEPSIRYMRRVCIAALKPTLLNGNGVSDDGERNNSPRVHHCAGQRPGSSHGGYGCPCHMNSLLCGRLGCGGWCWRKRHLDERRWDGLESVGGGGDVVAGEAAEGGGGGHGASG